MEQRPNFTEGSTIEITSSEQPEQNVIPPFFNERLFYLSRQGRFERIRYQILRDRLIRDLDVQFSFDELSSRQNYFSESFRVQPSGRSDAEEFVFKPSVRMHEYKNAKLLDDLASTEELELIGYKTPLVPNEFICPISNQIMDEPVSPRVSSDPLQTEYFQCALYAFEQDDIERWLEIKEENPMNRNTLTKDLLIPNEALKLRIHSWLQEKNVEKTRACMFLQFCAAMLLIDVGRVKDSSESDCVAKLSEESTGLQSNSLFVVDNNLTSDFSYNSPKNSK